MNERMDPDPLDQLRSANPVAADQLTSASLDRMRARIQEKTMNDRSEPTWRNRRTLAPVLGAVAVAAFALVALIGPKGGAPATGPGPAPATVPGASTTVGSASCVEQYSTTALKKRAFAFAGTVTAITGDEVTFTVDKAFKGARDPSIKLTATGMTGTAITSLGGPNLAVGQRYLVAGEAHFAWACGFTQPYDASVAAEWATAFGG